MKCAFDLCLWRKAHELLSVNPDLRYGEVADKIGCTKSLAEDIVVDWRKMNGLVGRRHPRGGVRVELKKSKSEINRDYHNSHKPISV